MIWAMTGKRWMQVHRVSRRKMYLCIFALVLFVVLSHFLVSDFEQTLLQSLNRAGYIWSRGQVKESGTFVEAYCKQRNQSINKDDIDKPDYDQVDQICIYPRMNPCDPEIAVFEKRVLKVDCSTEENWVYVDNGTFRISRWARWRYGNIVCKYAPILRGKGDYDTIVGETIEPMLDGAPLVSDFFKVTCISPSGVFYHNVHVGVAYNRTLHSRSNDTPMPKEALGYDVFMFGFDSTSRLSWIRNLPRVRKYFLGELNGIELEGYNIVGDGTVQALLPILTGKTERELPTARRDDTNAIQVDNYPWIWDKFKQAGYVTAWAEDMAYIGTFQMRLRGFQQQPTDHCMRPYFLQAESMYKRFLPWCVGSESRHMRFLNWFRDLYHMYENKPKFMFGFHSEYSHNSVNDLKKVDQDFYDLLKYLRSQGYLNRTILVLMGDHGGRFSELLSTPQGKMEERMPYFAFSFPPSMMDSHYPAIRNFRKNTRRLTTPFDVHETFLHMLNFSQEPNSNIKRGISLFKEVSTYRSCHNAGVDLHWCACLDWTPVSDSHKATLISEAVIDYINQLTSHVRHLCAFLTVKTILSLSMFSPKPEVLRYKKSVDIHGDLADMSDNMTMRYDHYQIKLTTSPGGGRFEVTVKRMKGTDEFNVNEDISRTNRYNDDPSCIRDNYPNIRAYCYCI